MRSLPRISITAHGLAELLAGLALTVTALALDLGGAGTVLVFAAGVTLAGVGLGAADALALSAHQSLDRLMVMVISVAAIIAAATGNVLAATILLVTATALFALEAATRWSRPLGAR